MEYQYIARVESTELRVGASSEHSSVDGIMVGYTWL